MVLFILKKEGDAMLRVKFNGKNSMQEVEFKKISDSVVQLTGKKVPKSTKGFKMYRLNGALLGDYSEYTEIVAEVENGLQYGKKGR
jgi:hypothetical protein